MYTMKKYDSDGHRLTNCCGAFSTFMEGERGEVLCCKACYREVSFGEGDGSDDLPSTGKPKVDPIDEFLALPSIWSNDPELAHITA